MLIMDKLDNVFYSELQSLLILKSDYFTSEFFDILRIELESEYGNLTLFKAYENVPSENLAAIIYYRYNAQWVHSLNYLIDGFEEVKNINNAKNSNKSITEISELINSTQTNDLVFFDDSKTNNNNTNTENASNVSDITQTFKNYSKYSNTEVAKAGLLSYIIKNIVNHISINIWGYYEN